MENILQDRLEILANDEVALQAIRASFEERIEKEKPDIETTEDNEALGERYRAYLQAIYILNEVMVDIESRKNIKVGFEEYNKGK